MQELEASIEKSRYNDKTIIMCLVLTEAYRNYKISLCSNLRLIARRLTAHTSKYVVVHICKVMSIYFG